jgi:kynurenine formamidase
MFGNYKVVDLTLPLGPATVMWPGAPAPQAETVVTVAHDGYFARLVHLFEHSGTHVDAPCHFVEGHGTVDNLPLQSLISPAIMIDASADIAGNPDGALEISTVNSWEKVHGRIPDNSVILLRTGWEDFYSDPVKYGLQKDGLHFPGFGIEATEFLVNERNVVGIGLDTLGIDRGVDDHFPVHSKVTLPRNVWHIENLTNLKSVPPIGALVFVGVLPLVDGSGSPARILAMVPE